MRKHFVHYWHFVWRIHWVNSGFPQKEPVMQRFVYFVVTHTSCWTNSHVDGDFMLWGSYYITGIDAVGMILIYISLKQKCRHFDEIFITGCTESCQNDNFRCSQWLKFHQNDNISVSVITVHTGPMRPNDAPTHRITRRSLTLLPLDKMAAILQTIFSDAFFVNEKFCILIQISMKFVPRGQNWQ